MTHTIQDKADAENYLARLSQFPEVLGQLLANLKIQEEIYYIPPKRVLNNTLQRIGRFPDMLVENFSSRVEHLAEKEELVSSCQEIVNGAVELAFDELTHQLQKMPPQAVDNVSELPGGKDYYTCLLKDYTTSSIPPSKVHQICKDEVERLQKGKSEMLWRI